MNILRTFSLLAVVLLFAGIVSAATITASPTTGRAPLTVSFWGDSPLWFGKYTWSFGDDTGAVGQNVSHTYWSQGTYQVNLVVFDYWGIGSPTQHARIWITVNAGQTGSAYISTSPSPASGNAPLNIFFQAVSSFNNVVYEWDFGDNSIGFGQTITHIYSNSGSYLARLFVKSNNTVVATYSVIVNVNQGGPSTGSVFITTTP